MDVCGTARDAAERARGYTHVRPGRRYEDSHTLRVIRASKTIARVYVSIVAQGFMTWLAWEGYTVLLKSSHYPIPTVWVEEAVRLAN